MASAYKEVCGISRHTICQRFQGLTFPLNGIVAIHTLGTWGSEPICGGTESFPVSSENGCRLSALQFDRFAPAEKVSYPPFLHHAPRARGKETNVLKELRPDIRQGRPDRQRWPFGRKLGAASLHCTNGHLLRLWEIQKFSTDQSARASLIFGDRK